MMRRDFGDIWNTFSAVVGTRLQEEFWKGMSTMEEFHPGQVLLRVLQCINVFFG